MRGIWKAFAVLLGLGILASALALACLYFGQSGLPNIEALASFAPLTTAQVSDPCLNTVSTAIPYDSMGKTFSAAFSAAEAGENGPSILSSIFRGWSGAGGRRSSALSALIARSLCFQPARNLDRQVKEIRTAIQIERRFSKRERFTILANRTRFADDAVGVEAAARRFFCKEPAQLTLAEAALLAGLPASPRSYSPFKYPDRALLRRNDVIDAMAAAHAVTVEEAEAAKRAPLGVVQN